MRRWLEFFGLVGLVVFLFGVGAGLVVGSFTLWMVLFHVFLGVVLVVVWFLFSGVRNMAAAQQVITGRTVRYGLHASLASALFLGILVFANWYVHKYDRRWDLTNEGVFSLSPQSIGIIQKLQKPLKLAYFIAGQQADPTRARELFDLYQYTNSDKVTTEIVDPQTKPHLVDSYEMTPGNLVYVGYGEGDNRAVMRLAEATEEAITNAVIKLSRGESKKIYFVQGHGEVDTQDAEPTGGKDLAAALGDEHFTVETITLSTQTSIPDDAAAVFLLAPKKALLPQEKEMLKKYAESAGRLELASDPMGSQDVRELAEGFGIEILNNAIVDPQQRIMTGPVLSFEPIVMEYGYHPITKGFTNRNLTVFRLASSVKSKSNPPTGVSYVDLAKTSRFAWGEMNLAAAFDQTNPSAEKGDDDQAGPVALAVAYEKKLEEPAAAGTENTAGEASFKKVSRVVVFGDSDFLTNQMLGVYFNRDLILNTVNWLSGEEGGITVRPKSLTASRAPIPSSVYTQILAASLIIPELLLLFGLWVWWGRRTRATA